MNSKTDVPDRIVTFSDDMNGRPMSDCQSCHPAMLTVPPLRFPPLAPVPRFTLAVNPSTKSFNVTVQSDKTVKALWCYRSDANCMVDDDVTPVAVRNLPRHLRLLSCTLGFFSKRNIFVSLLQIDPSESPWALLSFPYFLPCVCVQVLQSINSSFFFESKMLDHDHMTMYVTTSKALM